jgi:hypothetical protein
MSDQYPMDRNGAMEQSESVGPLTRIATPAHLGPIMSPLHITECPLSPNPSAAHARDTMRPARDTVRNGAAGSGHGAAELIRAGYPLGDLLSHVRHAQSAGRSGGS